MPIIVWTQRDTTAEERQRLASMAEAIVMKGQGAQPLIEELRRCISRRDAGK
jgi:hypothetical protein